MNQNGIFRATVATKLVGTTTILSIMIQEAPHKNSCVMVEAESLHMLTTKDKNVIYATMVLLKTFEI